MGGSWSRPERWIEAVKLACITTGIGALQFLRWQVGLLQAVSSGLLIGLECSTRHQKPYCVHRCAYVIGFNNSQNPEPTALRLYARAAFLSAQAQMAEMIGCVENLSR